MMGIRDNYCLIVGHAPPVIQGWVDEVDNNKAMSLMSWCVSMIFGWLGVEDDDQRLT